MTYIDLGTAPTDPIERLLWLSGLKKALDAEVDLAWQDAYYEARLQGQFEAALALGLHSKKRALAWTRHGNEARGRSVWRWRDGY